MRSILIVLLTLIVLCGYSQKPIEDTNRYFKNDIQYGQRLLRGWFPKLLRIPDTVRGDKPKEAGAIATDVTHKKLLVYDGVAWNEVNPVTNIYGNDSVLVGQDTLPGGPFSSVPQVGFNPGNNLTPTEIVKAAFYASQDPIANITGGQTLELMGSGADLPFTLNWTAGRNFATQAIQSITVAGVNKSFSQPGLNSSVNGTHAVTVERNENTTFVIEVVTTDGKNATASTSYNFAAKKYAGWSNTSNPNDATILAGNINEFSNTPNITRNQPAPTTPSNFFYAYPASFGELQSFVINGFESIEGFTLIKRNLQNASGYVQEYNIYVTNNQLAFGLSFVASQNTN